MSQLGRRVRHPEDDPFDYAGAQRRARVNARTVPHIIGTSQTNYGRRKRAWMMADTREAESAQACRALVYRRRHHAPPASVAPDLPWSEVADVTDTWTANVPPATVWS